MKLEIRQSKIALRANYEIFINGNASFTAISKIFRLFSQIELKDQNHNLVGSIKKHFSFLRAKYEVDLNLEGKYMFSSKSIWRSTYELDGSDEIYNIYGHKGRKHSIFINEKQVAFFTKNAVTFFDGDIYIAETNNDLSPLLIASIIIILDNYLSNDSDGNTITFDFGNIGSEEKQFNASWLPNEKPEFKS